MMPISRLQYLNSLVTASGGPMRSFIMSQLTYRIVHLNDLAERLELSRNLHDRFRASLLSLQETAVVLLRRTELSKIGGGDAAAMNDAVFCTPVVKKAADECTNLVNSFREEYLKRDLARRQLASETLDRLLLTMSGLQMLCAHSDMLSVPEELRGDERYRALSQQSSPLLVSRCNLSTLTEDVVQDIRAFCVEKFGLAPSVSLKQRHPSKDGDVEPSLHTFLGVPSHASFIITELMKNAFSAHIKRYGVHGVDDAAPVECILADTPDYVSILIRDEGGGFPLAPAASSIANTSATLPQRGSAAKQAASSLAGGKSYRRRNFPSNHVLLQPQLDDTPYFMSSPTPQQAGGAEREPTYQYSRDFGVPFSGHGLGLARSRLFALLLGGELTMQSQAGRGTDALLVIEKSGAAGVDVW